MTIDALSKSAVTSTYFTTCSTILPYSKSSFSSSPSGSEVRRAIDVAGTQDNMSQERTTLSPPSVTKLLTISSSLRFSSIVRIADHQKFDGLVGVAKP